MKKMTEANLWAAFAGESQAHMKYMAFAAKAKADGLPNIGRLFQAISFAEQAHATSHLKVLGGLGNTSENLGAAQGGEDFEVESMYPAYAEVAKLEGEQAAGVSIHRAFEAEKIHRVMYSEAKKAAEAKKDATLGPVQVCANCGYTIEGDAPDKCPICSHPKSQFVTF
jgi:rubrerythrin